jgi:integrase
VSAGSVFRRGDTWTYALDLGPDAGGRRRYRRKGGFRTRKDAQTALHELRRRVDVGQEVNDKQTVAAWLEIWFIGKENLRPTTARGYRAHLDKYLIPHLGGMPLERLRAAHISEMMRAIKADGVAGPITVRRIHATLRSALNAAVKQQRISVNPAVHVELPETAKRRVRPWEPEELGQFLDYAMRDRLGALYELIAMTGLRRGEAIGLRWMDVELERGFLTVRQQIVQLGHQTAIGRPKTSSGEDRRVDLDEATIGCLLGHQLTQAQERSAWGTGYVDQGLVFTRENGEHLHPEFVTRHFQVLTRAAGLRDVRLHDLRHGQASLMLAAGVSMAVVSKRLGHSSIAITSDTYSHLLEGVGRDAAERASALVPRGLHASRTHLAPKTPQALLSDEQKARSDVVRRQGLEPRTRRLRVCCSAN